MSGGEDQGLNSGHVNPEASIPHQNAHVRGSNRATEKSFELLAVRGFEISGI